MRVIDDLSTVFGVPLISSGCTNPVYGQAEDYPVYISASGVLPVTFNSFTGELKNKVAMLSWTTSAEQNLKSFDIEKSTNGREFSKIGSVDALNNSSSTNRYTYTDQNLSENNYYRIRTNETTGSEKLSSIVLVHYTSQNESLWLVKNPFTNSLQIGCGKPGFPARLRLLNSVGAVVAEKTVTTQLGQMEWNIQTSLSSGVYILTASAFGQTFTYKVIKQD
jgi:trimeric autotransporter adhesin